MEKKDKGKLTLESSEEGCVHIEMNGQRPLENSRIIWPRLIIFIILFRCRCRRS